MASNFGFELASTLFSLSLPQLPNMPINPLKGVVGLYLNDLY